MKLLPFLVLLFFTSFSFSNELRDPNQVFDKEVNNLFGKEIYSSIDDLLDAKEVDEYSQQHLETHPKEGFRTVGLGVSSVPSNIRYLFQQHFVSYNQSRVIHEIYYEGKIHRRNCAKLREKVKAFIENQYQIEFDKDLFEYHWGQGNKVQRNIFYNPYSHSFLEVSCTDTKEFTLIQIGLRSKELMERTNEFHNKK